MKQYYVKVLCHDGFRNVDKYRYLIGSPEKAVRFTDYQDKAEKYSKDGVDYYMDVFESNGTSLKLEEA